MRPSIVATTAAIAGYAVAQNTTATASTNLFIGAQIGTVYHDRIGYAASIINACADETTYAVQCTSGPTAWRCGPDYPASITVTQGPSTYIDDIIATIVEDSTTNVAHSQQTCDLQGTTAASCNGILGWSSLGTSTTNPISSTITYPASYYYQVAITASASATTCSSSGAASPADAKMPAGIGFAGAIGIVGMFAL